MYHPRPGWVVLHTRATSQNNKQDHRLHEQEFHQIIQAREDCIDEAVKSSKVAGYPRSSIEVVGASGIVYIECVGQRTNTRMHN